ncbi:MAG: HDOD domain-containing protein [Candidatus Eisenbacteria bacterium]|nr:HDOD domain-containing protein [Candidatus Eisenbacteria bacterium]
MIGKEEILKRIQSLHTLPASTARLSALVNDPKAGASDFEAVIRPDPALTANLLRMANSAYFGLSREVTSVRQAITLLGIKRVYEVASSVTFSRMLPATVPGYEIDATHFWLHCVGVAVLAERLAEELGRKAPDLIFTAGLLHDMGKLAIGSFLVDASEEVFGRVLDDSIDLAAAEKIVLGMDHADVGSDLAEHWNLPGPVSWAARWHHNPGEAPENVDRNLVDLVHVADGLAHSLGLGADRGELARTILPSAIERLGVNVRRLEFTASETIGQIYGMTELFSKCAGGVG